MSVNPNESATDLVKRMLGVSGDAVVQLVEQKAEETNRKMNTAMANAAEAIHTAVDGKIQPAIDQLNQQHEALTALAAKIDSKADGTEFNELRSTVAKAGRLLAGAKTSANEASAADNPEQAGEAADKAAKQAGEADELLTQNAEAIKSLEQRVSELEKWQKETVNPALNAHRDQLDKHEQQLKALEADRKPAPLTDQTSVRVRPISRDVPTYLSDHFTEEDPEMFRYRGGTQPRRRTLNEWLKSLGWGWMAWLGAGIGALIALVIALVWFCPWISHVLNQQWPFVRGLGSLLMGAVLVAIGIFSGGLLGDTIAKKAEREAA